MGRQARRKAEQRDLKRREKADPEFGLLAQAADAAFTRTIPPNWRIDWAGFEKLRTEAKARLDLDWPDWCYLPWMVVAWQLAGDLDIAAAFSSGHPGLAEYGMDYFGQVMASLIPWRLGRVAVRFDPDLEAVLASTPLNREIPGAVLHALPMWSIYLATPQFDQVKGVFVSLDAACTGPGVEAHAVAPQPDSLAAQDADLARAGKAAQLGANRDDLARLCGRPYEDVVANVLGHVLYLCSDEPDIMRGPLREVGGGRVGRAAGATPGGVQVWSAGYRLGAALRRARLDTPVFAGGEPTGRTVAPHMRSSHWHLYWTGPMSEARVPVLKLLAPVAVNFRLEDGEGSPITVVRPVRAPG